MINIFGLSFSMSVGMLIIVLLIDQLSYDNFISRANEMYRIQTRDNLSRYSLPLYASTTFPLSKELRDRYAFIEKSTALNNNFGIEFRHGENLYSISGLYAEENFFDFFSFNLLRGNRDEVLKEPYSIVLTEETAKKIFGDNDPIGKTISVADDGVYTVTGITESNKLKSHIQFESLVSVSTSHSRSLKGNTSTDIGSNWERFYSSYVYIIPHKGTELSVIESALEEISSERYGENEDLDLTFYLYPFNKIVPGPVIGNELGVSMPRVYLIFFGGLALVVIISAAFNYTSLSIARSLSRAREFGVRKGMGASRKQLVLQIFIESVSISLLSLIVGIGLLQLILPVFKGFKMMALLQVDPAQNLQVYIWFIVFAVFTGFIAGALPAIYISRISPVEVLKGSSNVKIFKRLAFRKILLVTQYFFSIVFIITIILIYRQMIFMVNADMGFDREKVYNIECRGKDKSVIRDIFSRIPEVNLISFESHVPGVGSIRDAEVKLNINDEESILVNYFSVEDNYLETMGLKLVAGNNFPADISKNNESYVLITQQASESFNFGSVLDAPGSNIILNDTINLTVAGVIEDYRYCALFLPSRPLLLRYKPSDTPYAVLRLDSNDLPGTVEKLKQAWKEIDPDHEMQGQLLDTEIRDYYSYFEDILYMVGYTTFLALIIAGMGLYGMASYTIQTRIKEVGIRKVYGAETRNVVKTVSKSFIKLLAIAIVIGAPVGFLLNNAWLSFISSHVAFGFGTVFAGILVVIITGLSAITSQTIRVSRSNPADTLKYE
ncbi:MAG: ABC transporter permease [Marinilabiliaceae bacterium]|nr:ABC transporter permease [Marinilabiliaceae bacterium]